MWILYWQLLEKIGLLFSPTSGHTVSDAKLNGCGAGWPPVGADLSKHLQKKKIKKHST